MGAIQYQELADEKPVCEESTEAAQSFGEIDK
jgi:hypothetical protein